MNKSCRTCKQSRWILLAADDEYFVCEVTDEPISEDDCCEQWEVEDE